MLQAAMFATRCRYQIAMVCLLGGLLMGSGVVGLIAAEGAKGRPPQPAKAQTPALKSQPVKPSSLSSSVDTPKPTPSESDEKRVFNVSVEQTTLPPGMYGQWNVDGELIETDYPPWFQTTTNDIWILMQGGGVVLLLNPRNGAQTALRIEEVVGNRAQFFHIAGTKYRPVVERPNITVSGDQLTGETIIEQTAPTIGGGSVTHTGRYRLVAHRMSVSEGRIDLRSLPTVQQSPGRLRGQAPAPNFQILPVQQGSSTTRPFGAEP